jgi:hypothetical protein
MAKIPALQPAGIFFIGSQVCRLCQNPPSPPSRRGDSKLCEYLEPTESYLLARLQPQHLIRHIHKALTFPFVQHQS